MRIAVDSRGCIPDRTELSKEVEQLLWGYVVAISMSATAPHQHSPIIHLAPIAHLSPSPSLIEEHRT